MRNFAGRDRSRLRAAQENGYLDTGHSVNPAVLKAFGLWCWKLKIPMVWSERNSPHSRYGIVRLEMFTTPNLLTTAGQSAIRTLCSADAHISPHDARCNRIPLKELQHLSKAVFRAAISVGNYRLSKTPSIKADFSRLRKAG